MPFSTALTRPPVIQGLGLCSKLHRGSRKYLSHQNEPTKHVLKKRKFYLMSCKSTAVCLCMDVHCESKSSHWVPLIPCLHWSQSFRTSPQSSPPQFAHDTEWQPAKCYCGSSQMLWKGSLCISMSPNPEKKPPRRPTRRSAFTATCKFWRFVAHEIGQAFKGLRDKSFFGSFFGRLTKKKC